MYHYLSDCNIIPIASWGSGTGDCNKLLVIANINWTVTAELKLIESYNKIKIESILFIKNLKCIRSIINAQYNSHHS